MASGTPASTTYRLAVVVETTYTQGTAWPAHRDAIERYVKVLDALVKKHQFNGITSYQLAWVLYGSDDSSSPGTVYSTSWTSDVGEFRQWADGIRFQGGGEKVVSRLVSTDYEAMGLHVPMLPASSHTKNPSSGQWPSLGISFGRGCLPQQMPLSRRC